MHLLRGNCKKKSSLAKTISRRQPLIVPAAVHFGFYLRGFITKSFIKAWISIQMEPITSKAGLSGASFS